MNALSRMDELSAEVEVLESCVPPRPRPPTHPLTPPSKLAKTAELTQRISLSLKKLSTSASQVEAAVKPIYSKTQSLTVLGQSECVARGWRAG